MRKETFKVGYQKPKSSPLQGIEPGSSCIVVLQFKKIRKTTRRKGSPLERTEPGRVFAAATIVFTDGLHR